ncbi:MAG: Smr/MutS family protein, partial [Clostridia bacterium]
YTENNSCTNLNYSKYTINNEINLRHLDKDEAIFELDKYITQVINSNISDIVIIHGKNSPILKPAVHYYLKNNKHILNYYLDNFNIGITHAKIK